MLNIINKAKNDFGTMKATKQPRYQNRYGSHPTYKQAMAQVKTNFTTTRYIQQAQS